MSYNILSLVERTMITRRQSEAALPPQQSLDPHRGDDSSDVTDNSDIQNSHDSNPLTAGTRSETINDSSTENDEHSSEINESSNDSSGDDQTSAAESSVLRDQGEETETLITAYRRQSTVMILLSFFLVKLWIDALTEHNEGLLLFCMVATLIGVRAVQHRREMERQVTQRRAMLNGIREDNQNGRSFAQLSMYSYEVQLARALEESHQMHVMTLENGMMPVTPEVAPVGVSDSVRNKWKRIKFDPDVDIDKIIFEEQSSKHEEEQGGRFSGLRKILLGSGSSKEAKYNSVSKSDIETGEQDIEKCNPSLVKKDDDNVCSICLCEYEKNDDILLLPCGHFFHDECVTSWTNQSVRCPLCNCDLNRSGETAAV